MEQADLEAKQAEFRENNPDVVADFRARTEELFHSLDGQSAEDIEKQCMLMCNRRLTSTVWMQRLWM